MSRGEWNGARIDPGHGGGGKAFAGWAVTFDLFVASFRTIA